MAPDFQGVDCITIIPDAEGWHGFTSAWASSLEPHRISDDDIWETVNRYGSRYPLPVGRASLQQFMAWDAPDALIDLMPFAGVELAAYIARTKIEETTIEAFGLCRLDALASTDEVVYRIAPMQFRLTGPNPGHTDVVARCRALRTSWSKLAGTPIPTGRRWDDSAIEGAIRAIADSGKEPTFASVAKHLYYPEALDPSDSLRKRLKRHGQPREEFEIIKRRALS